MKPTSVRRPTAAPALRAGQLAARVVKALFPAPAPLRPVRVATTPPRRPAPDR